MPINPIGIDLGTTYTVVSTIDKGRPRIIPNAAGQHLTPSVVAFVGGEEPLVGHLARLQASDNPEATVFSIKRRMGYDYKLTVADREYTPQEISSFILRKVKADAESYLGEKIDRAVITVPAYFNERQRQATKEAGVLAGLDVMRIINEPTAAALAYGLEREDVHTILVWDLGGGTFDVSILELGEGIFEVKAVSGDTWLGGDDIDQRVMDHLAREYRKTSGIDFPADAGLRQRLREEAEKAKIQLSTSTMAPIHLPLSFSQGGRGVEVELSREQLEALTTDLLQRMAVVAQQALKDADLSPAKIDRVILVGGATRMPAVRRLVKGLIGKDPYRYIDPDEVVATGAAIHAGMLLGLVEKAVLLDVLPLSLGVETQGGLAARIIPRNTPLPASGSRLFTTAVDYQTSMDLHVIQGERELALDDISLGRLHLTDIPSALRGVPKVEVAFEVDVDGILRLSAVDLLSGNTLQARISSTKLLDSQEIASLAEEAVRRAEQDSEKRQQIEAGIEAENLIAAAEVVQNELTASELLRRQILQGSLNLKDALAGGMKNEIRSRSNELRRLLMASPRNSHRSSKAVVRG